MILDDIKVGDTINHPEKGVGIVTIKTPRTVTTKYEKSTTKTSFFSKNVEFNEKDL